MAPYVGAPEIKARRLVLAVEYHGQIGNPGSTLVLGVPLLAAAVNPGVSYTSPWFLTAGLLATLAAGIGLAGRVTGRIILCDPRILYDHGLRESCWEFKKNAIFYAGQHFRSNRQSVDTKGTYAKYMTIVLLLSVLVFIVWIATSS